MAFLAKKIGKRAFASHLAAYEPRDTLYEDQVNGSKKRVRRELPPGLSPKEAKVLKKLRSRAHYLDKGMNLCGFRVGWTFFIGLIPVLGDIIDALLNYNLIVKPAKRDLELPDYLVAQMMFNNIVSAGVGLIPLVGDIILGIWKSNSRNTHLVEEFLALKAQKDPYRADEVSYGGVGSTSVGAAQVPIAAVQPSKGAGKAGRR